MKASHLFNLLDARGVISVSERQAYIARVRTLAKGCCETWVGKAEASQQDEPMSVLFVEIGCEEIPARLQVKALLICVIFMWPASSIGLYGRAGAHGCKPASYGC